MKPLTEDQRKLVEDNRGIAYLTAYRMVNQKQVPPQLTEDAVQEAMIGLMQAAQAYEPERGLAFSTLASCCCRNRVLTAMYMLRKQCRAESETSLDEQTRDGEGRRLYMLVAENDTEAEAVDWLGDMVRETLGSEKAHWAKMLIENANGSPMHEIAKARGVTRQNVCTQINRARKKLQEAMANAEC